MTLFVVQEQQQQKKNPQEINSLELNLSKVKNKKAPDFLFLNMENTNI